MSEDEDKETARLKKQRLVVEEMVDTEGKYLTDLHVIIEGFLQPCRDLKAEGVPVFDADVLLLLFSNVEELCSIHDDFYTSLQSVVDVPLYAGVCFLDMRSKFKIYGEYCANVTSAEKLLNDLLAYPVAGQTIKRLCIENNKPMGLMAELHKPVQRILKYPLLLKELLKNSNPDEDGYEFAITALASLNNVAEYINDIKRRAESCQKILELQPLVTNYKGPNLLLFGLLLNNSTVKILDKKKKLAERHLFLFEKAVFITKHDTKEDKYIYKSHIDVAKLTISDVTDGKGTEKHILEMSGSNPMDKKNCSYTICFKSSEEKEMWMSELKKLTESSLMTFLAQKLNPMDNIEYEDGTKGINLAQLIRGYKTQAALRKKLNDKKESMGMLPQIEAFAKKREGGKDSKKRLLLADIKVMTLESAPASPQSGHTANQTVSRSVSSGDIPSKSQGSNPPNTAGEPTSVVKATHPAPPAPNVPIPPRSHHLLGGDKQMPPNDSRKLSVGDLSSTPGPPSSPPVRKAPPLVPMSSSSTERMPSIHSTRPPAPTNHVKPHPSVPVERVPPKIPARTVRQSASQPGLMMTSSSEPDMKQNALIGSKVKPDKPEVKYPRPSPNALRNPRSLESSLPVPSPLNEHLTAPLKMENAPSNAPSLPIRKSSISLSSDSSSGDRKSTSTRPSPSVPTIPTSVPIRMRSSPKKPLVPPPHTPLAPSGHIKTLPVLPTASDTVPTTTSVATSFSSKPRPHVAPKPWLAQQPDSTTVAIGPKETTESLGPPGSLRTTRSIGSIGPTGSKVPTVPNGPTGAIRTTKSIGSMGPAGLKAPIGSNGPAGSMRSAKSLGPARLKVTTGPNGPTGSSGPAGSSAERVSFSSHPP